MQSEGRDGSIYRPPETLLVFMAKRREFAALHFCPNLKAGTDQGNPT